MQFKLYLEGVLDHRTTFTTRAIISSIKRKEKSIMGLQSNQHYQFMWAKDSGGDSAIQKASSNTSKYVWDWASLDIPEGTTGLPNILAYVSIGEVIHNGYYDRTNDLLFLNIQIPKVGEKLDYHALIPMLKAVVRHELEHSEQPNISPYTRRTGYKWDDPGEKAPQGASFADPASVHFYLSHPSEVEAWVAGMYKYAKTAKVPFTKAMDVQLDRIGASMKRNNVPDQKIGEVLTDIKNMWLRYQASRFPKAQLDSQQDSL